MIAVLLPVKRFSDSKHRLAGFLTPAERARLARTMFEDVWAALGAARAQPGAFDRLLVVSAEAHVLARCRAEGVAYLEEAEPRSHSDSVSVATRWVMRLGVTSLLSVPIDTPAVSPEEILTLLALGRQFSVVIVPSRDGAGTNALLRNPPDAIHPCFGPGSCGLHVQQAQARGLSCQVVSVPGLAADIDTPEDLENFLAVERHSRTRKLVQQLLRARPKVATCP